MRKWELLEFGSGNSEGGKKSVGQRAESMMHRVKGLVGI